MEAMEPVTSLKVKSIISSPLEGAQVEAGKPPRTLGLAFACQEVENVPLEPHDQQVQAVLTERELIPPR